MLDKGVVDHFGKPLLFSEVAGICCSDIFTITADITVNAKGFVNLPNISSRARFACFLSERTEQR